MLYNEKEHILDFPPTNPSRTARAYVTGRNLFDRAYFLATLKEVWARMRGKSRALKMLDVVDQSKVTGTHLLERRAVRIANIVGSEGRADEYDCDFLPRRSRVRARWVSVAAGMIRDPSVFDPINVVQVGDEYYVKDGHHRVSVAKRLGYLFIDANVTVWEMEA